MLPNSLRSNNDASGAVKQMSTWTLHFHYSLCNISYSLLYASRRHIESSLSSAASPNSCDLGSLITVFRETFVKRIGTAFCILVFLSSFNNFLDLILSREYLSCHPVSTNKELQEVFCLFLRLPHFVTDHKTCSCFRLWLCLDWRWVERRFSKSRFLSNDDCLNTSIRSRQCVGVIHHGLPTLQEPATYPNETLLRELAASTYCPIYG